MIAEYTMNFALIVAFLMGCTGFIACALFGWPETKDDSNDA